MSLPGLVRVQAIGDRVRGSRRQGAGLTEHDGCRVITNLGVYQDSKHLHWHVGSGKPPA